MFTLNFHYEDVAMFQQICFTLVNIFIWTACTEIMLFILVFSMSKTEVHLSFELDTSFLVSQIILILTFFFFFFGYNSLYNKSEGALLINAFCVISQLACFLEVKYKKGKKRKLLLLCFFCTLFFNLCFVSVADEVLSSSLFIFFLLFIIPLKEALFLGFLGHLLNLKLTYWGFNLSCQLFLFHTIEFFFLRKKDRVQNIIKYFILLFLHYVVSISYYHLGANILFDFTRMASLFSGACVVFLSLKRRSTKPFLIIYFFYFLASFLIACRIAGQVGGTTLYGIPYGIPSGLPVFCLFHFWGLVLFFLLRQRYPEAPWENILFSVHIPFVYGISALQPLERWISGFALLIFLLQVILILDHLQSNRASAAETRREISLKIRNLRVEINPKPHREKNAELILIGEW